MTIPIPAVILEHYRDDFEELNYKNIEWILHGYKHIDLTKLNYDECLEQLTKAKTVFNELGIDPKGFRAPYLRSNDNVIKILSELGITYDSSSSVFIDVIDRNKNNVDNILNYYNSKEQWVIEKKYNVKVIPVILPDDEILVDRLKLKNETVGEIWLKVAKICLKNGWVFVLQLHPDRIEICSEGLRMLLNWAEKNDLRLPSLSEIADEEKNIDGHRGAIAITGDLDVLSIWDYFTIS